MNDGHVETGAPDAQPVKCEATVKGVRVWPAVVLTLLALGFLAFHWLRVEPLRQNRVLGSIFTVACYGFLMTVWAVFFSRLSGKARLGIFVVALVLVVGGPTLFRIKGVSGDMIPILAWRWNPGNNGPAGELTGGVSRAEPFVELTQLECLGEYP